MSWITKSQDWIREKLNPAQARIAIAGVGSTILAPILAVLPTTVPVPISRLGHIEKDK